MRYILRVHPLGFYGCFALAGVLVAGVYELWSSPEGVGTRGSELAVLGFAAVLTVPATQLLWGPLLAVMEELGLRRMLWPVVAPVATMALAALAGFVEGAMTRLDNYSVVFGTFLTVVALVGASMAAFVVRGPLDPGTRRRRREDAF
ncbi:hypothetical protein SPF06_04280 [Sinomonas sp. JGH33]|uniref:Major facilitator superfamily (MFS) profile domain-containing protein n=1 Tax=Sinomonas terricola TaxID=3110330 RepID=A0ABU5T2P3_9MICC|nr:hypothetical protein [Sinomonas sp. JGH33]MEA5453933.1 hypothetical protein [Sinomonas sp. JGH33]